MNKPLLLWVLLSLVEATTARSLLPLGRFTPQKKTVFSEKLLFKAFLSEINPSILGERLTALVNLPFLSDPNRIGTAHHVRSATHVLCTMTVTMFPLMIYDKCRNLMRGAESFRTGSSRQRQKSAAKKTHSHRTRIQHS